MSTKKLFLVIAGFNLLAACGTHCPKAALVPEPCRLSNSAFSPLRQLGSLDGKSIRWGDLPEDRRSQIEEQHSEQNLDRFSEIVAIFEELVLDQLITEAAQQRGIDEDSLLKKYGNPQVSEEEIKAYHDAYLRDRVSYEVARELLYPKLVAQKRKEIRTKAGRELLVSHKVNLAVPLPKDLLRAQVPSHLPGQPLGSPTAKLTILEFSDFQCPFCSVASQMISNLVAKDYPNKVKLYFRHFPLDMHPQAGAAAIASHCAEKQGKFWEYHDQLFAHQDDLSGAALLKLAKKIGLNIHAFNACLQSEDGQKRLLEDQRLADELGVRGTPCFFVNGIKVMGARPELLFKAIIQAELEYN